MVTKKSSKGTKKSAKKSSKKGGTKKGGPIIALYAVPIHQCIQRGDPAEMKAMASKARAHIASVKSALAALEKKMGSA